MPDPLTKSAAMMADPPADGAEEIRLDRATSSDVACVIVGVFLLVIAVAGAVVFLFDIEREEIAANLLFSTVGAGLAVWAAALAAGSLWRLVRPGPAIVADATGLRLHPSLGPAVVGWSDLISIDLHRPGSTYVGPSTRLRIRFARPVWSTWVFIGGCDLELPLITLGLSYRKAQKVVKQLRALQQAATATP